MNWIDTTVAGKLNKFTLHDIKKLLRAKAIAKIREKKGTLQAGSTMPDKKSARNKVAHERKPVSDQIRPDLTSANTVEYEKYNTVQLKDVFICHASEDKKMFIEPLIEELSAENISCWYDNTEIKWGDSIVKKVNQGLSSSRFVLVALSMHSIKKHWPNAELEASINIEFSTGETKVLPLLIGNDHEIKTIMERYPILSSKLYVNYSIGVKEISRLLKERIILDDRITRKK